MSKTIILKSDFAYVKAVERKEDYIIVDWECSRECDRTSEDFAWPGTVIGCNQSGEVCDGWVMIKGAELNEGDEIPLQDENTRSKIKYTITDIKNHTRLLDMSYDTVDEAVAAIRQAFAPLPVTTNAAQNENDTSIPDNAWGRTGSGSRELVLEYWSTGGNCFEAAVIEEEISD